MQGHELIIPLSTHNVHRETEGIGKEGGVKLHKVKAILDKERDAGCNWPRSASQHVRVSGGTSP
jgi:hypothetical protein